MRELVKRLWEGEPVYVLTFLATFVPMIASGLVVFQAWSPTADQLAWVTGVPATVGAGFGIAVRRNVSPVGPNQLGDDNGEG